MKRLSQAFDPSIRRLGCACGNTEMKAANEIVSNKEGDGGIMTVAYLNRSTAAASLHQQQQSLARWQPMDVIEEGVLRSKNNVIAVPERPGLGVTLSPEKLRICHEHSRVHGPCAEFINPRGDSFIRLPRF